MPESQPQNNKKITVFKYKFPYYHRFAKTIKSIYKEHFRYCVGLKPVNERNTRTK